MARKKRHQSRNYVHAHFRILSSKRTLEQIRKFPDTFGYVWTAEYAACRRESFSNIEFYTIYESQR